MTNPITDTELASLAVAPRVTLQQVEDAIAYKFFFSGSDGVDGRDLNSKRARSAYQSVRFIPLKDDVPIPAGSALGHPSLLTFCVLVLRNGYTVYGASACASPENYNQAIGEKIAYDDAVKKIWPLLNYELKTQLSQTPPAYASEKAESQVRDQGVEPQASAPVNPEDAGSEAVQLDLFSLETSLEIEIKATSAKLEWVSRLVNNPLFFGLSQERKTNLLNQHRHLEGYLETLIKDQRLHD